MEYFTDYGFIQFVQSFSNSFFNTIFKYITMLGDEIFYLILIPVIYLCLNKITGLNLITFYLISSISNTYLKDIFHTLRPSPQKVRVLIEESSYAFPSNHAQGAVVFWGYLFSKAKKIWIKNLLLIIIFLISLSRIYLGVHFPIDILSGWLIGFLILIVLLLIIKKYRVWEILLNHGKDYLHMTEDVEKNKEYKEEILSSYDKGFPKNKEFFNDKGHFYHNYLIPTLIIIIPLILFFIYPTYSTGQILGVISGIVFGAILEGRYVKFNPKAKLYIQIMKIILALAVAMIIRIGLKRILPPTDFSTYIRYFIMGFWLTFLMPLIIKKAGWQENKNS